MAQVAPQSGFSSQGQLSWNELVQQPLSYTVGVLNRISNAGQAPSPSFSLFI